MLNLKQAYKKGLGKMTVNFAGGNTQTVWTSRKDAMENFRFLPGLVPNSIYFNGKKVELATLHSWSK